MHNDNQVDTETTEAEIVLCIAYYKHTKGAVNVADRYNMHIQVKRDYPKFRLSVRKSCSPNFLRFFVKFCIKQEISDKFGRTQNYQA